MAPLMILAGCVDGAGVADPPPVDEMSCESFQETGFRVAGPEVDAVFVISDAPAMAPYRDALREAFANYATWSIDPYGDGVDLHLAVVGPDGFTGVLVEAQDPWFTCPDDPDACRHRSYDDTLADAIAALADMPAGADRTPLLQRMDDAFESHPELFRAHAELDVFLIGATDDASDWDPSDYAIRLQHRTSRWPVVRVVTAADAPRLEEFASWFEWGPPVPIDATWASIIAGRTAWSDLVGRWLDPASVDLTDLDPDEPGLQADCFAEETDGTPIPRCRMDGDNLPAPDNGLPCFWLDTAYRSPETGGPWPYVERESSSDQPYAHLRCTCPR